MRAPVVVIQGDRQQSDEKNLVKLRRMTGYAVAKVYSPGELRRRSIRIIGQSSEKTPNTPEPYSDAQWDHEEISCPRPYPTQALHHFHCEPSPQQAANDRFSARLQYRLPRHLETRGLFQQAQNPASQ